jgi:hypothetical protein
MTDDIERAGLAETARQRAIAAYENARGGVAGAGRKATDGLKEAPLIALAGGIAAGALIAALLPRTRTEAKALRPTVRRVRQTAKAAVDAARETGTARLDELGLTREKGEQTIRSIFDGATDAAKASAKAAADAVRSKG